MTQDAAATPDAEHGRATHVRDRGSQSYLGMQDLGPAGDRLRRRIDWMADQAQGSRVLDVGCGEGILELLLARRGIEVTGVDIDSVVLDFAREMLSKEPDEVRGRVELVHGDFIRSGVVKGRFDTVILGEVLDHVDDPRAMLDRCLQHLRPAGLVVTTTHLGLNSGEDGRQPLRLTDTIKLLRPRLALEVIEIEDEHVRFAGRLSEGREVSWEGLDAQAVLSMTEAALAASQQRLHEALELRGDRIEKLEQRVDASRERTRELERQAKFDRLASDQLKIAKAHLKKLVDAKSGEVRVLRHRLQATRSSTSFRVGSALVQAAKRPFTLWKLPFQLWRLYRSASRPAADSSGAVDSAQRYRNLPPDLGLDVSQFVSYPPLSVPDTVTNGPPVAAILDKFTEHSLRYEINLLLLSRENWRSEIEEGQPKLLLVESAFSGNNSEWRHLILGSENLEDSPLRELIQYCRSFGIPAVFWNKEDPPHFDEFVGTAREFDFVFTSDSDCVPMYRAALGHDRVYVLPFAAQPKLHNPSREEGWPRYPVCFAGSWLQHKYPDRAEALRSLLDPALPLGLHIFDRNLTLGFGPNYRFPDRYKEAIKGSLTYEEMLTAYRCYDVMLNVNTVTESPTMFARRAFESLACGTPVISSESVGMSRMLGEHVRVARSAEETAGHLLDLLGDEEESVREGHLAYRYVHENHTYRHRMDEVFSRVGLETIGAEEPTVSVLMPTMRPENVARCLENFGKQTYPRKELVLILNNAEFDLAAVRRDAGSIPNVQVLYVDGRTSLGDCLNRGVEAASGKYVAKMDDDDHYGGRYLSDSVLAASFSDAEVVGKGLFFVYFEAEDTTALFEWTSEHTFKSFVTGGTLFVKREVAKDIPFDSVSLKEDTNFQRAAAEAGCRIYSADRFNFIRVRARRLSDHADQTPAAEFLKKCRDQTEGLDLERVMI